jgi:hypothetical protein
MSIRGKFTGKSRFGVWNVGDEEGDGLGVAADDVAGLTNVTPRLCRNNLEYGFPAVRCELSIVNALLKKGILLKVKMYYSKSLLM